jgi:hypothetical protein
MKPLLICITGMALIGTLSTTAEAQDAAPQSIQELWQIIQEQQSRIEQLEKQADSTAAKATANEYKVDATGDYLDNLDQNTSTLAAWAENTQIGGYGELHYNNLDAEDPDRDVKEADFHRFVMYLNHQFNERLRFFSEIELEHAVAGDDEDGEFELEQAYIEYDIDDQHSLRGGVFLLPVGILNETHEPNTFYGVERNAVENIIIPTSWWEAGAATDGRYSSGLSWDIALSTGLEMSADPSDSNAFRIRSGRQKASEASANDLAYTARLKYTGITGLELATSYQLQSDVSQQSGDGLDEGQLFSAHLLYNRGMFALRSLYAGWKFDGFAVEAADADDQKGWYVEPSLKFRPGNYDIGFYTRYESLDGYRGQDQFDEWEAGFNYWPIESVVLKFDYRDRSHDLSADRGRDFTGFDLGLGYSF